MKAKHYCFTVADIASAIQEPRWFVYKAIKKGWFNPNELWSVYCFIEQHRVARSVLESVVSNPRIGTKRVGDMTIVASNGL